MRSVFLVYFAALSARAFQSRGSVSKPERMRDNDDDDDGSGKWVRWKMRRTKYISVMHTNRTYVIRSSLNRSVRCACAMPYMGILSVYLFKWWFIGDDQEIKEPNNNNKNDVDDDTRKKPAKW